jgi:hypothetical protein
MNGIYHYPFAIFAVALLAQWLASYLGHFLRRRAQPAVDDERADFGVILGASLTLLALIIGFTFSMAVSRFDERKDLEEAEAKAIRTEYLRAEALPPSAAAQVRALLAGYTQKRILFFRTSDPAQLRQIDSETARLQSKLWAAVVGPDSGPSTPKTALAMSGMNDVLNAQNDTEAAFRNHIPTVAWGLLLLIAIAGNVLLGASEKRQGAARLVILPIIIATPFLLIADVDSPRAGFIRVVPVNLVELSQSFSAG